MCVGVCGCVGGRVLQQVSSYTNFDQLELATTLQKHELLEMRRVAGTLYNKVPLTHACRYPCVQDGIAQHSTHRAAQLGMCACMPLCVSVPHAPTRKGWLAWIAGAECSSLPFLACRSHRRELLRRAGAFEAH